MTCSPRHCAGPPRAGALGRDCAAPWAAPSNATGIGPRWGNAGTFLVLPSGEEKRRWRVVCGSSNSSNPAASASKKNQEPKSGLDLPGRIAKHLLSPLSNFGFGKRSLWEGGVGLFVVSGVVLLAFTLAWVKGWQLRANRSKYEAIIEFSLAQGISVGTPVRIRGVSVGSVVGVKPSLEKIDVVVEVLDAGIVIPRNALVEVNQSGLISETLIDITPRHPVPSPTVGPLHPDCLKEGMIVCDRERIKGEQGVSLDELVGICTKLARQVDDLGVKNMYGMAEKIGQALEEAKPLLGKVQNMAGDVEPLLKELRDGQLIKDLENLAKVVTDAGQDLRTLNKEILTSENTELLRQSISTLTKTLKHVESISEDVSGLTGDAGTRYNLRQLIESLSRLMTD